MSSRARHLDPSRALLVVLLALATAACTPSDDDASADATAATEEASAAPAAAERQPWLGEIRVGGAVDPEGAVPADRETTRFAPGDSVYVSMSIDGAPANAAVHAVFYDAAGDKIAEDEKKVPADARYLYFDAGDTSNWLPGAYRVDVAVDGRVRSSEELTLTEGGTDDGTEAGAEEGAETGGS